MRVRIHLPVSVSIYEDQRSVSRAQRPPPPCSSSIFEAVSVPEPGAHQLASWVASGNPSAFTRPVPGSQAHEAMLCFYLGPCGSALTPQACVASALLVEPLAQPRPHVSMWGIGGKTLHTRGKQPHPASVRCFLGVTASTESNTVPHRLVINECTSYLFSS